MMGSRVQDSCLCTVDVMIDVRYSVGCLHEWSCRWSEDNCITSYVYIRFL